MNRRGRLISVVLLACGDVQALMRHLARAETRASFAAAGVDQAT